MGIKKHLVTGLLLAVFLFCICPKAFAAPTADLSMQITEYEQVGDAVEFNVIIGVGKPSEPYASLDFTISSSDEERLHIVDLSASKDKSPLAFEFTPEYGGVYHKGRINEIDGSVSYLVGFFSQASGNNIADEANICSVRFRYTGDSEEEISLENLKLVYKNPKGEIAGVTSDAKISRTIVPADPSSSVQVSDDETLLGSMDISGNTLPESTSPVVNILGAATVVLAVLVIILLCSRIKKPTKRRGK